MYNVHARIDVVTKLSDTTEETLIIYYLYITGKIIHVGYFFVFTHKLYTFILVVSYII